MMPDHLDENLKAAVKAFEDADDLFREDPKIIFGSESERKRALFASLTKKWKAWERSGPCMYKGCGKTSIARSHAIHKAGPIEQIAEQQHVLTPAFSQGGMTLARIGVREASTFPGFCEIHEQLFSAFETARKITDGHQTVLQAFRTLCREIARKRIDVEHGKLLLEEYRTARLNYYKTLILRAAPGVEVKGITHEGNKMEELLVSLLGQGEEDLGELEGDLYNELFQYVDLGRPEPCVQALEIPLEIPISLSGLGVFHYGDANGEHRALCLVGVLPQGNTTLVFMSAARLHCEAITHYLAGMQVGFGALNAIESWMVHGSDHWFIRPSAWDAIPAARQSIILEALGGVEHNIGSHADFSILDDVRRYLIDGVTQHLDETDNADLALQHLKVEAAKLVP